MKKYLFLVTLLSANAVKGAQVCKKGEEELCEDLTGARIEVVETSALRVHRKCGWQAKACAKLTMSPSDTRCKIYLYDRTDQDTLIHEMNHCRGWDHNENYARPWKVMSTVEKYNVLLKEAQQL